MSYEPGPDVRAVKAAEPDGRAVRSDMSDRTGSCKHVRSRRSDRTCLLAHVLAASLLAACGEAPAVPAPAPVGPEIAAITALAPVARIEAADLWQDLLAQRPSALTMMDERLVVDLGRPASRVALELMPVSPWRLAQEVG